MAIKHKVGGWIWDTTRKQYNKILKVSLLGLDDQQMITSITPVDFAYSLGLLDTETMLTSFTHYLIVEDLDNLYPYIGTNVAAIEVLYGE
jgi:hypothetical protein